MEQTEQEEKKNKKSGAVLLRWLLRALLLVLLFFNLWVIMAGSQKSLHLGASLPWTVLPVISNSMEPEIRAGDSILVVNKDFDDIQTGENVVYLRDGELIVHQVTDIRGGYLITRGLANQEEDQPVSREEYRACMVRKIPFLGGLWRISSRPAAFLLFAVLVTTLIFGDLIFGGVYRRLFERENEEA